MAGKLVISVMAKQKDGFFLAPYDLEQRKFVGPVKFINQRASQELTSIVFREAMECYREPELDTRIDGATQEVFDLCLEYGAQMNPIWRRYITGGKR